MKTQQDEFMELLFGDRSKVLMHALAPPGVHRIMLCDSYGCGAGNADEVNCPDCIAIREGRASVLPRPIEGW